MEDFCDMWSSEAWKSKPLTSPSSPTCILADCVSCWFSYLSDRRSLFRCDSEPSLHSNINTLFARNRLEGYLAWWLLVLSGHYFGCLFLEWSHLSSWLCTFTHQRNLIQTVANSTYIAFEKEWISWGELETRKHWSRDSLGDFKGRRKTLNAAITSE